MADKDDLSGKTLIDVANILQRDPDNPPAKVGVPDGDSLAEQIQHAFPQANVVKSLNTMNCLLMVNPKSIAGEHVVFVSGNDANAKLQTAALLQEFGWEQSQIVDLGDITTARGPEMYLALWLRIMQSTGTPSFNIGILR